jgi:hypothetical protein
LILVLSLFHPIDALDEWADDFVDRIFGEGLTVEMMDEYVDMAQRHPGYFGRYVPPPPLKRSPSSSSGMGSSVEQWRGLVGSYFPANQVNTALCVMRYESGGNPNANNSRSTAIGLMQILASLWGPVYGVSHEQLKDPNTNMRVARGVWDRQGWGAWAAYRQCR